MEGGDGGVILIDFLDGFSSVRWYNWVAYGSGPLVCLMALMLPSLPVNAD